MNTMTGTHGIRVVMYIIAVRFCELCDYLT